LALAEQVLSLRFPVALEGCPDAVQLLSCRPVQDAAATCGES
jgi:hypothetical protein